MNTVSTLVCQGHCDPLLLPTYSARVHRHVTCKGQPWPLEHKFQCQLRTVGAMVSVRTLKLFFRLGLIRTFYSGTLLLTLNIFSSVVHSGRGAQRKAASEVRVAHADARRGKLGQGAVQCLLFLATHPWLLRPVCL